MRRNLLVLLGSLAFALLLAEAGVRLWRPGFVAGPAAESNPFWTHDPDLGWFHRPGQKGTFSRPEFTHRVSINSMGFRDVERDPSSPAFRIAVLGDSFTWGHGVGDEDVFTRILEELLPGVEVWNLGVSAYSTDQELLLLRRAGARVGPDLVLVMLTRNDFAGNMTEAYGAYFKPRFLETGGDGEGALRLTGTPVPRPSTLITAATWLRRRSAFANGLFHLATGGSLAIWEAHGDRLAQLRLMERILEGIAREAADLEAECAVALVPSVAHVYYDEIHEPEGKNSRAVMAWGGRRGVPVLDMTPGFRRTFAATGLRYHYPRDKHWNVEGNRLAAEILAALLVESGLLPPEEEASPPR